MYMQGHLCMGEVAVCRCGAAVQVMGGCPAVLCWGAVPGKVQVGM